MHLTRYFVCAGNVSTILLKIAYNFKFIIYAKYEKLR